MSGTYNNNNAYADRTSAECVPVTNGKWTVSMSPNIRPAKSNAPYRVFDEKESGVRIWFAYYGGKQLSFRLSIPQFKMLCLAVNHAVLAGPKEIQDFNQGYTDQVFYWNLAEASGEDTFFRIYPAAPGERSVTKQLSIKRERIRDGQLVRYPWQIRIEEGTGIRKVKESGQAYLVSGTQQISDTGQANLTDGMMKRLIYTPEVVVETFEEASRGLILNGYKSIRTETAQWRNSLYNGQ